MQAVAELTGSLLEAVLSYDPETGIFTHLTYRGPRSGGPGSAAGSVMNHGYVCIGAFGKRFTAHRLAWLWMTGAWPKGEIDHINGDRADNRWGNLREASRQQQGANGGIRTTNTTGIHGVCFDRSRQKYMAKIMVAGRTINLGRFTTLAEAAAARAAAEKKHFGGFAPEKREAFRPCR